MNLPSSLKSPEPLDVVPQIIDECNDSSYRESATFFCDSFVLERRPVPTSWWTCLRVERATLQWSLLKSTAATLFNTGEKPIIFKRLDLSDQPGRARWWRWKVSSAFPSVIMDGLNLAGGWNSGLQLPHQCVHFSTANELTSYFNITREGDLITSYFNFTRERDERERDWRERDSRKRCKPKTSRPSKSSASSSIMQDKRHYEAVRFGQEK